MMGRDSFKRLLILPLPRECIFSLLNCIISNQEHFQANSVVHSVNTRSKQHLHRPFGVMNEEEKFKAALKRY
jgi:hypothetical protein